MEEPDSDLLWRLQLHGLSLKQGQKQEHEDREGTALLKRLTEQSLLEKHRLKGNEAVTMPWLASA